MGRETSTSDFGGSGGLDDGLSAGQTQFEADVARGALSYGGFISMLQSIGVDQKTARMTPFGTPIGRGHYFSVYRHLVSPSDYESMHLSISRTGDKEPFYRPVLKINTPVAIKRLNIRNVGGKIDVTEPGQLFAISREIKALLHPNLRDHEGIVKLQAILWEDGLGTGYENGAALWPSLVMEYCETTLADYLLVKPLSHLQKTMLCTKIGDALDAVHSANIFHGDLKAENVLLKIDISGSIEPKLADFGSSILIKTEDGKILYHVSGTELWCAPECPGDFSNIEEIEATDSYSLALLMLLILADGRNPFEEFGTIPKDWSRRKKLDAMLEMKRENRLYHLICGAEGFENIPPFAQTLATMLIADPRERINAMGRLNLNEMLESAIHGIESLEFGQSQQEQEQDRDAALDFVNGLREQYNLKLASEDIGVESNHDIERDLREPLSFVSIFAGKSFIPDCASLSSAKIRAGLNLATKTRIVSELVSILEEEGLSPSRSRCAECCRHSIIDAGTGCLTVETLLEELQRHVQHPGNDHTCRALIDDMKDPQDISISAAIFGSIRAPGGERKGTAMWQLFLSEAIGFGTPKNPGRALQILEDACTSGFSAAAIYVLYAIRTNQAINPNLPVRTWLVSLVLFSAGIPSDAFDALSKIDQPLSRTVAVARSKVYNGSTASFPNLQFNSFSPQDNIGLEIIPGFKCEDGVHIVQDELFENTLLHLAAGSDNSDLSMIAYCTDVLGIDVNTPNAAGATPLLLACRAGREEKILRLLELGASVESPCDNGETPLHWLGILPDPARVFGELLSKGADINARVEKPKLLPNYIDGCKTFYIPGPPIVWAMALDNEAAVELLIQAGADLTSISLFACQPRLSKFLPKLIRETSFKTTREDAYVMMASWSQWNSVGQIKNWVQPKMQEESLDLVLSSVGDFHSMEEVFDFFHPLVSEAVSESPIEILEIVLRRLGKSVATVKYPSMEHTDYVQSPISHASWAHHYFVHEAAKRGDAGILKAILRMNVSASAVDSFGWTALHVLSAYSDNPDCVDILISHGAISVIDYRIPPLGFSAFMNAVAHCNFKVADALLSHIPEDERKRLLSNHDVHGTILPKASLIGNFVAWAPYFGKRPLEYLCNLQEGRDEIDLVFNASLMDDSTLLMFAAGFFCDAVYDKSYFAKWRRRTAYDFLITMYSEPRHINAKDKWGRTALHLAAGAGNLDMAIMLMEHGADLNAVDDMGLKPIDVLFQQDPPQLQDERDSKNMIISTFEEGRNGIYTALKNRGVSRDWPSGSAGEMTEDYPRPYARSLYESKVADKE